MKKGHMPEFYMLGEPFRTSLKPGMLPFQRLMQVTKDNFIALCVWGLEILPCYAYPCKRPPPLLRRRLNAMPQPAVLTCLTLHPCLSGLPGALSFPCPAAARLGKASHADVSQRQVGRSAEVTADGVLGWRQLTRAAAVAPPMGPT